MFKKPNKGEVALLRKLIVDTKKLKEDALIDENEELASTGRNISRKNIVQLTTNNFANPTYTETIPYYLGLVCVCFGKHTFNYPKKWN